MPFNPPGHRSIPLRTRSAGAPDGPFLAHLFAEVHRAEFAPLGLPAAALDNLLAMQARAQALGYAGQFPHAEDRIVLAPGLNASEPDRPVGRILVDFGEQQIHLVDVALLPEVQGLGLGSALLQELVERSEQRGLPIALSVQPANRALGLYRRFAFAVVGDEFPLRMVRLPINQR